VPVLPDVSQEVAVSSAEGATVVALDVGGTTIKGARADEAGRELQRIHRPTRADLGPDHVVGTVLDVAAALARPGTLAAGLAVPGIIDAATGLARMSANLGWRDVPLRRLAEQRLGMPVVVEQDARAATVAELRLGLGRELRELLVVVIGTGVAAGLVIDGRVVAGAADSAGEFGHLPVYPGGEPCGCGQRGCVEAYASAGGIARRFRAAGGDRKLTVAQIADRLEADPLAARIWAEGVAALALGLASATLLMDPARIVLAGGLSNAGDRLLDPLRTALQDALAWRTAPPVEVSPLGDSAGRRGAALLAWGAMAAALPKADPDGVPPAGHVPEGVAPEAIPVTVQTRGRSAPGSG
jgi:glucokinase